MPVTTIPLAFSPNQRGPIITSTSAPTKDARMVRCFTTVVPNPITGTKEAFVEKWPGWAVLSTPAAGSDGTVVDYWVETGNILSSFDSGVYTSTQALGDAGNVERFNYGRFNGVATALFRSSASATGWYLPSDATSGFTFTGNFTSGNSTVSNVSSFTGLYVGQALSTVGAQVPADTRIQSLNSGAGTLVMTQNAGANGTGTTVTREGVAKILDTDGPFGALRGDLVELDGYAIAAFSISGQPYIAHSDLNAPWSWSSTNRLPPKISDLPVTLMIYRDMVMFLGAGSLQFFRNAGNPSGSVLSQVDELTIDGIGCHRLSATAGSSVTKVAGVPYFIGVVDGAVDGIYRMNGFSAEKVSSPSVTRSLIRLLEDIESAGFVAFDGFTAFGLQWIYVGGKDSNIGYLYCIDTGSFVEAGFMSNGMRVSSYENGGLLGVRLDGAGGKLYVIDNGNLTYQDDSAAYTMTVQTPALVLNKGAAFTVKSIELLADTQSAGTTTLELSRDDYGNFTTHPATFDMTATRKKIYRCGFYKNHMIARLTHSHNSAFRAQALVVDWEPAAA